MAQRGEDITTSISMDVIDLKAGIQEANRQIKLANSKFKEASSSMDDWANSADGLSNKLKQLNSLHDAEIKKLNLLKKEHALVVQEQGENSKAAEELQIKINNQQAAVNRTQKELDKYNQRLAEVTAESNRTKTATEKLSEEISDQETELASLKSQYKDVVLSQGEASDEAQELASRISALNDDLQENRNKMNDADSAADSLTDSLGDVENEAEQSSDGFTIMGGALAELTADAIQGAISAIGDFIGSLFELSEATEEYRIMQSKLEGSANTFGYSIDFANEKYQEFYRYLGDDQMATNAITNLMGLGTSTENVSDVANAAIAVWTAYGDSIPIEGLTESINETAQVAKVTGSLADALNWAGISEDEFNEKLASMSSTQERADYIAQTLNATYGESKTTYDELTGTVQEANEAELKLKDTQAQLGEALSPVNTAFADLKNKALEVITPMVEYLADAFMDLLGWLKEHPAVLNAVLAVVTGLATAFGVLAGALAIQALINGITKAFALLNVTMAANPIMLVVTAIAGLVAAFATLWNTSEGFRNFWIGLWNSIVDIVSSVINTIVTFFSNLWATIVNIFSVVPEWFGGIFSSAYDAVTGIFSSLATFFSDTWNSVTSALSGVADWFGNIFSNAYNAVTGAFSGWVSFFSNLWEQIKDKFSTIGTSIAGAISDSVKSGINGIISAIESTINAGIGLINGAIDIINYLPGVEIGHIGDLEFPRLAKGGFALGSALANIGEAGKEVVLPLERNLGWAKLLASELIHQMGGISGSSGVQSVSNSNTQNVTFNQYVTSPKALSSMDVYRKTNSLLFSAKVGLKNV